MRSDQCKSCKADILWARTIDGKAMPVDAKPEKRLVAVTVMLPQTLETQTVAHEQLTKELERLREDVPHDQSEDWADCILNVLEKAGALLTVQAVPTPSSTDAPVRVVDTYISHFATCPNANQHRKPKKAGV